MEHLNDFAQMFWSWTKAASSWIPVVVSVISAIWATLTAISNHADRVKLQRPRKLCAVRIKTRHEGGVEDLDEKNCVSIDLFFDRIEIQRKRAINDLDKSFEQWVSVECYPMAQVISFRAEADSRTDSWFDWLVRAISRSLRIANI